MKSMLLVMMPTLIFIGVLFSYLKMRKFIEMSKTENKKWITGIGIGFIILTLLIGIDYFSSSIIMKNAPTTQIELSEISNMTVDANNLITFNNEIYRLNTIEDDTHISIKKIPQKSWGIFGASTINMSKNNFLKINEIE